MATTLNISLDDETFERARSRKEKLGLTWAGVIKHFARNADGPTSTSTRSLDEFSSADGNDLPSESVDEERSLETDDDVDGVPEEVAGELDLPGQGETLDHRRATILRMYRYLVDEGSATRADFLELVDTDDVDYSSAESFWANAVKGRDSLRALPGVETPPTGRSEWRYAGE